MSRDPDGLDGLDLGARRADTAGVTDDLITTRSAASLLGVGTTSVKRWADEGTLPCVKTAGGHRRFRRSDVMALLRRGDAPSEPPAGDDVLQQLALMSSAELDALEYGVVQIDDDGTILQYNRYEEEFAGRRRGDVVGRHFFTDVAPCTNNRLLYGRFKSGVATGALDLTMDYTFTYKMAPRVVSLRLARDEASQTNWLLVHPR